LKKIFSKHLHLSFFIYWLAQTIWIQLPVFHYFINGVKMIKGGFLCVALICITSALPISSMGQDLGSDSANVWLAHWKMSQAEPVYQAITVAQIEDTRSFNIVISQLRVLTDTGWYGRLWKNFRFDEANLRPLFEHNSEVYADSIVSNVIHLKEGDTVACFVHTAFVYPPSVSSELEGMLGVRFEDSLDCLVELVGAISNNRLARIDSVRFIKADSLVDWYGNMLYQASTKYPGMGMDLRYVVPQSLDGLDAKVRLSIHYYGAYGNRWIERDDGWQRHIDIFNDTSYVNSFARLLSALCPYIPACDTMSKPTYGSNYSLDHTNGKIRLSVYPNPTKEVYNVKVQSVEDGKIVIRLINSLGVALQQQDVESTTNEEFSSVFDLSSYPKGVYFIVARSGVNNYSIKKLYHK